MKIKLTRPFEKINKNASYKVFIGNTLKAVLKNGDSKVIDLNSEEKNSFLIVKSHWCGSKKITLSNLKKEMQEIKVYGNNFFNKKMPLVAILILMIGVSLTNVFTSNSNLVPNIVIGIGLLLIAASLTLWKNKWIELK